MNNDALVRALGWALVHSLWQAAMIALLLLILLPRFRSARQRYRMAYGALLGVFLSTAATAWWYFVPGTTETAGSTIIRNIEISSDEGLAPVTETLAGNLWQGFSTWLEQHNAILVTIWLAGFAFFLLRLSGSMWQIRQLRTRGVCVPEADLTARFNRLRVRLGYQKAVVLLESTLIKTPMALGWLKPVVLLPLGIINQLSIAEVEAVLAHELAHIARRDWIFNLLQAFMEGLFYYHPAVWWISAVVRRERENCCDDAALAATGNPLAFAKALVLVQEQAIPVPVLALGLRGKRRKPLLDRVRRILNQPPQQHYQAMEKITATFILLALLALVGLRANSVPTIHSALSKISELPAQIFGRSNTETEWASDTLPKPKTTHKIVQEDGDQKVEAEYQDGKLTHLNINGKDIPESEYNQHEDLLENLLESSEAPEMPEPPEAPEAPEAPEMPEMPEFTMPPMPPGALGGNFVPGQPIRISSDKDDNGNTVIVLEKEGKPTEIVVKGSDVFVDGKKLEKGEPVDIPGFSFAPDNGGGFNYSYSEDDLDRMAEDAKRNAEMQERNAEHQRDMASGMRDRDREYREQKRAYEQDMDRARTEMKRGQKEFKKSQKDWEKQQKQWEKQQKEWAEQQKSWEGNQHKWEAEHKAMEAENKVFEKTLKNEMIKDGLITNPESFSMQLNEKEMIVNKKKQSEELHKKYLELIEGHNRHKIGKNDSFNYNYYQDNNDKN